MNPWHLGDLHAYEQALVLLLAFGPFILLGVVVFAVRRRDLAEGEPGADRTPDDEERPDGPG